MPERNLGVTFSEAASEREANLEKLRMYIPELFTVYPNTVRTAFMEADDLLVFDFNDPSERRRFQSEVWNQKNSERAFLTFYKRKIGVIGWQVRAVLQKLGHQAICIWSEDSKGLSKEVEIKIGDRDDELTLKLDYHRKLLTYEGDKGAIPVELNGTSNIERFEDDYNKSRFPERVRLHNALFSDTNLFYVSYEVVGKSEQKEVLIVPIQIARPNT